MDESKLQDRYNAQELLDSLPLIVTVIDPVSYRIRFENQAARDFFGPSHDTLCHETITQCPKPCDFCLMPAVLKDGRMQTAEITSGGKHLLVCWSEIRTPDGERHVAETILDITERKQVEEALRRSEARFRFFMDNSPAIAFIKDDEG